jgi:hypothetical protein
VVSTTNEETAMSVATSRMIRQERVEVFRAGAEALRDKAADALQVAAAFGDEDAPAYDQKRAQAWMETHRECEYQAYVLDRLADEYAAYL